MKKINAKLIDGSILVNATLTIKDNGLYISTENDELIKLTYDNIENYQYNDNELIIISTDGQKTELECKAPTDLINALEECIKSNSSENKYQFKANKDNETKSSHSTDQKYKAVLFMQKGQANVEISILYEKLKIESNNEILEIPYSSIIKLTIRNDDINLLVNNNNNYIIRCDEYEKLYDDIKSNKDESIYDVNSKISLIDVFGNDLIKANNSKNKTKLIFIIIIVVVIIFAIRGCMNMESSPADVISSDIRSNDFMLGYATRYAIGEVISSTCNELENDGKGRYIVKCNVVYYPKRNNGSIATDSKMNETIYAMFLRTDKDHFSRYYTSKVSDNFKKLTCWGQDKSKGIICNN